MPLLGAHISTAGGIELAPGRGAKATCETIQIFTKGSRQWTAEPLTDREAELFKENLAKHKIRLPFAHDSYLINIGSPDRALHKKSLNALIDELKRAEKLGLLALVLHPGAHVGSGEEDCLKRIADSINQAHQETPKSKLFTCLENTAGQGTNVGYRFEHLARLIELIEDKKRVGVCFDTQHAFAAGYDISTEEGYEKTFREIDKIIGIKRLKCFHLNDSKKELGSRVDRHEHIGKGLLGLIAFRCLLNDPRFRDHPMSLETPKGPDMKEDIMNLKTLRRLIKKPRK